MKRETQRGLYLIVMKLCLFTLLTLTFLLLMAVNNPQIIRPSRTMAITLTGFVVLLALFTQLYRSFDIRHEQSRHIIYSTLISCIIADVGTYFELLIMNFNEANRSSLMPESGDLGHALHALGEIPLLPHDAAAQVLHRHRRCGRPRLYALQAGRL